MNTEIITKAQTETTTAKTVEFGEVGEGRVVRHGRYGICQKLKCIIGSPPAFASDKKSLGIQATAYSFSHNCPVFINKIERVTAATGSEVQPEPERFVTLKRSMYRVRGNARDEVNTFDRRGADFLFREKKIS